MSEVDLTLLVLVATFGSLFVSSIAGYGGSLLLVPALVALLGPKEGIALAALVLAWNNVFKVVAYRRTLPLRRGWPLMVVSAAGVLVGARLLIAMPERFVYVAVLVVTAASLFGEIWARNRYAATREATALPIMGVSAFLSGVSGSSGPLKGIAIRNLGLGRLEHVGLASCVSLVGDGLKAQLFAEAGLLPDVNWSVLAAVLPAMPVGAWVGQRFNRRVGEQTFRWVFWSVVGAYTLRMFGVWV